MNIKKFFNLPMLSTYLVAFVLLISLVINSAGLVKSGILYIFPGEQTQFTNINTDTNVTFTDGAKNYYKTFISENFKKQHLKNIISSGLITVIFLLFFSLALLRAKKINEEISIPFTIQNLYFYLVCIITLFITIFSSASAITTIVDYNYPNTPSMPLVDYGYQIQKEKIAPQNIPNTGEKVTIDETKLKQLIREQSKQEKSFRYESMVSQITLIIIAIPVFLIHWPRIRKLGIA